MIFVRLIVFIRSLSILEETFNSYSIWNYSPDNSNQWGDNWNNEGWEIVDIYKQILIGNEDLSLYSKEQDYLKMQDRSLGAAIRPYALRLVGGNFFYKFFLCLFVFF